MTMTRTRLVFVLERTQGAISQEEEDDFEVFFSCLTSRESIGRMDELIIMGTPSILPDTE